MSDMSSKVVDTAKHEVEHVVHVAEEGAKSGAYLYPIRVCSVQPLKPRYKDANKHAKGIYYFASHKDLYKPMLSRLTPTLGLGLGVTVFMFLVTYLPQVAVLVWTSGPLAALTTALLVLSESSTLTMVLSKMLLIEDGLIDTFDGTLIAKGETELVAKERQVKSGGAGDAIARLGKLMGKPFAKFTPSALVRYFMYLPLNFIPVVGTVAFVLLQGRKYGPQAHSRYFQLKGMTKLQREKFVEERQGAYARYVIDQESSKKT